MISVECRPGRVQPESDRSYYRTVLVVGLETVAGDEDFC